MNKVIADLQKEFANLQKNFKKRGDELVKRVKSQATKENLMARGKEIEKLVEKELKRVEPAVNKFLVELRKNAKKAGIDLDKIEKNVRTRIKQASKKARAAGKKATARKATTKAATRKASTAEKASAEGVDSSAQS